MTVRQLLLVGCGLLVANAKHIVSNPVMLLLSYGAHTMAQPPAHVVGITIAPNAEPLAVPASELNNSVVLLLSAGIRDVMTMKSLAVPPAIRTNEIVVDDTDLDLLRPPQSKVHAISGITAALSIVSGAFVAILGFKMRRLAALLCGFAVGGLSCYALATTVLFSDPSSIVLGAWLSFLVGGLLVGVICMLVEQVGNFVVGASGGASMTILIHISFNYLGSPSNPNAALYIFGAILSLTLGLVAVLMGKPLLIVATGLTGALEFVWGIGYFVGQYPCVIALPRTQYLTGGAWHYDNPSAWWVYLSASLAVAIVGIGLQFAVTAVDAPPKKPQDLHHATRKSGHRDVLGPPDAHRHTHRINDDAIELVEITYSRHGRFSRTLEDDLERNPHRYGEGMEPVTETAFVTIRTPRNMHDHEHRLQH
ncbi:hypothetical protein AaE_008573 [Aphanomyces astaci]|uniref:Transmembrane protein 198 n=1 Tax=Aphanomyces astaci TaxID=112090 RepID=A0A6A5A6K8_APHAT|nr:hypothetical protein AaE_008573 [Aphanomyces astaci]